MRLTHNVVRATARCLACGSKRIIAPGEIPVGEVPICFYCYTPMVLESVDTQPDKRKSSEAKLEAQRRYAKSPKGLATRRRHRKTDKHKLTQKQYQQRRKGNLPQVEERA